MLQSVRRLTTRLLGRTTSSLTVRLRAFHRDYNAAGEEQSFKLSDGRTMGFAEYGDPEGVPAFFLHGALGLRYDGLGLNDIAKKLSVHVIRADRPSHGLSSFQHSRKLIDYPLDYSLDISQLAKHLDTPQYNVFSQSSGGPYVVACAYGSPSHKTLNVAVVAGMGPPEVATVKNAGMYTVAALAAQQWIRA